MMTLAEEVLDFWFDGGETMRAAWWTVDPTFDAEIAARFSEAAGDAAAGRLDEMAETADGALALVILLDQFARNLHRNSPRAFAADPKARQVADAAIRQGFDLKVTPIRRAFFYLPFEHSEALADQDRSVALFEALGDAQFLDFAKQHRDVIARFGRFPHRNDVLGRSTTPAEAAFLTQPGSSFGGDKP